MRFVKYRLADVQIFVSVCDNQCEQRIHDMKTTFAAILFFLFGLAAPIALSGCAAVAGVAAGAAAADFFVDDNNVCDGPNDAGLIDSDCHD